MKRAIHGVAVLSCTGLAGCGDLFSPLAKLPSCGDPPYFTALPVPAHEIDWADVVGRVGAPSQTLPKPHTGVIRLRAGVPLTSPGDITVDRVTRTRFLSSPNREGLTDYGVFFRPCREVSAHFAHAAELGSWVPAHAKWRRCQTYSTVDETAWGRRPGA